MKRTIILTSAALLISAGVTAQNLNQVRSQSRAGEQTQTQEQIMLQTQEQAQTQTQAQTQAQTREQVRIQNMTNAQEQPRNARKILRQERKQLKLHNEAAEHGQAVRERARTSASGPGKGEAVSQQARIKGETQQVRIRQETRALSGAAPRNQGVNAGQMQRGTMNMTKRAGSGRR